MTPVARRLGLDGPFGHVTLHYLEWGEAASARVVVCVHGLTRNAHDFDPLAAELARQGARVLAVDVAGRGRSSWLVDADQYRAPTYTAHLTAFMAKLGLDRVDWVGTSMGGLIGMDIAAAPATPIRRLVLNDVGPFVPRTALAMIAAYLGLDLRFADVGEVEQHLRAVHAPFGPLTDAQWANMARHSARRTRDGWRLHYDPRIKEPFQADAGGDVDLWPLWDTLTVPTFLLRGAESVLLTQEITAAMAGRGPRPVIHEVAGVGHAPALLDPEQIAIVRGWLQL